MSEHQRGSRSKARKRALDILYAADLRGESGAEALDRVIAEDAAPPNPYTGELVKGVSEHLERIDEVLAQFTQGWSLARMAAVDRNVLRLGVYEMFYVSDVPDHVAITEAMALVKDLSTDESPQFVNGVLGAIERDKPALTS